MKLKIRKFLAEIFKGCTTNYLVFHATLAFCTFIIAIFGCIIALILILIYQIK